MFIVILSKIARIPEQLTCPFNGQGKPLSDDRFVYGPNNGDDFLNLLNPKLTKL